MLINLNVKKANTIAGEAITIDFTNANSIPVNHGFGYYPIVRVFILNISGNYEEIMPLDVIHTDFNNFTVTLTDTQTGKIKYS
jgi:hypothetical protein